MKLQFKTIELHHKPPDHELEASQKGMDISGITTRKMGRGRREEERPARLGVYGSIDRRFDCCVNLNL